MSASRVCLFPFGFLAALALGGPAFAQTAEIGTPRLVLHLSTKKPVVTPQEARFCLVAAVENQGKTPVTLIQPGDGSDVAWRTPIVGYYVLSASDTKTKHPDTPQNIQMLRCGNMNGGIGTMTLAPGKQEEIRMLPGFDGGFWLKLGGPGRYRIVFYYTNDPVREFASHPGGPSPSDPRIKTSTPCVLRSNEILLTVVSPASVKPPQ